jgi:hypothetical protein
MVQPDRPKPFRLLMLLVAGVIWWLVQVSPPLAEVATISGWEIPGGLRKAA